MLEYGELIKRQIMQESGGNPRAVSPAGAAGIMQVMPGTARSPGFGVAPLDWSKRFDPVENRRFGEEYMAAMLGRYNGDQTRALVAYNWGPGNADKWDGNPASLPAETQGYIRNILGGGGHAEAPVDMGTPVEAAPQGFSIEAIKEALGKAGDGMQAIMPQEERHQAPLQVQRGEAYQTNTDALALAMAAIEQLKAKRKPNGRI